ncbi:MAG: HTH domain-containing protein [Piscinibacter sp.]|uniref:HTH domain-containing protein n=1 Tax=Piscinibacter sp. TaxID=1903157 RepID=UPI00258D7955|nr:HTH domain-containing protein [Piscinibacter sp.]MCW5666499.1 HTH domain-containing protein [Piscinibacter sp.]
MDEAFANPDIRRRAELLTVLSREHSGRKHGVHAPELAAKVGVPERTLRRLITELREEGEAIVATPETGYYMAATPDDIRICCGFLRSRAMRSLANEARLRRIPLPELLGQLHLPT